MSQPWPAHVPRGQVSRAPRGPFSAGGPTSAPRRRASLCRRGSVCYSDRLHGIGPFLFLTALPGRGAGIHVPRSETLGSESRFQVLDQQG